MIDWFTYFTMGFSFAVTAWTLGAAAFKRKPSMFTLVPIALIEVLLLAQLVITIVFVIQGETGKGDIVELFGYLFVALMVPVGAVFWSLIERTRTSNIVLAVAAFTIAVMTARMAQIWGLF